MAKILYELIYERLLLRGNSIAVCQSRLRASGGLHVGFVTNPLNELAIIRLKTRKAFHTFLQAAGRASQQACVT